MHQITKKALATAISLSLLWTSGAAEAALESTRTPPAKSPELEWAPPAALGRITDHYNGDNSITGLLDNKESGHPVVQASDHLPLVILIQDLHVHYGVQRNIAGILESLAKKLGKGDAGTRGHGDTENTSDSPSPRVPASPRLPFALAVEGASGPIDSSVMALFPDPKIKQEAADYLMREGELTGAEYFAVMRGLPRALTGAEDLRYYTIHRNLFRKTLADRSRLVRALRAIQSDIRPLRKKLYSSVVRKIQSKIDAFDQGALPPGEYIDYLASLASAYQLPLQVGYPHLARFLQNPRGGHETDFDKIFHEGGELAFRLKLANAESRQEKDLIHVERDLALLLRVADLRATELEVRDFGPRLNQFMALADSLLDNRITGIPDDQKNSGHPVIQSPSHLRQLISSSIDYYVMALMRNKPLVENTLALIPPAPAGRSATLPADHQPLRPAIAVLVAGGFHTAPIAQMLREKNISYLVITPAVDKLAEADHELYVKRLSGKLLTEEEILAAGRDKTSKLARGIKGPDPFSTLDLAPLAKLWPFRRRHDGLSAGIGIVTSRKFLTTAFVVGFVLSASPSYADYFPAFKELIAPLSYQSDDTLKWLAAGAIGMAALSAGKRPGDKSPQGLFEGLEPYEAVLARIPAGRLKEDPRSLIKKAVERYGAETLVQYQAGLRKMSEEQLEREFDRLAADAPSRFTHGPRSVQSLREWLRSDYHLVHTPVTVAQTAAGSENAAREAAFLAVVFDLRDPAPPSAQEATEGAPPSEPGGPAGRGGSSLGKVSVIAVTALAGIALLAALFLPILITGHIPPVAQEALNHWPSLQTFLFGGLAGGKLLMAMSPGTPGRESAAAAITGFRQNLSEQYGHKAPRDLRSFPRANHARVVTDGDIETSLNRIPPYLFKYLGLNVMRSVPADRNQISASAVSCAAASLRDNRTGLNRFLSVINIDDVPSHLIDFYVTVTVHTVNEAAIIKSRILPPTLESAREVSRFALLHEIGELLWTTLEETERAAWTRLYRQSGPSFERNKARLSDMRGQFIGNGKAISFQNKDLIQDPAGEVFADRFAMHFDGPVSVLRRVGEPDLTPEESQFIARNLKRIERISEGLEMIPETYQPAPSAPPAGSGSTRSMAKGKTRGERLFLLFGNAVHELAHAGRAWRAGFRVYWGSINVWQAPGVNIVELKANDITDRSVDYHRKALAVTEAGVKGNIIAASVLGLMDSALLGFWASGAAGQPTAHLLLGFGLLAGVVGLLSNMVVGFRNLNRPEADSDTHRARYHRQELERLAGNSRATTHVPAPASSRVRSEVSDPGAALTFGTAAAMPETGALNQLGQFIQAIRQGKYQDGRVVDLRNIPKEKEVIVLGDVHARLDNIKKILNSNDNLGKVQRGEAVLAFLGDLVHREDEAGLGEMHSSVETMQFIMDLKIQNPDSVYILLGNHDFLNNGIAKGRAPQDSLYREKLEELYGLDYVELYGEFIQASPLMAVGDGFVAIHAGPVKGATFDDIKNVRMEDVPTKQQDPILRQAIWNRYVKGDYTPEDVRAFMQAMGQPDGELLVGHSPERDGGSMWEVTPNHHIIFAGHDRVGYVRIINERREFIDATAASPELEIADPRRRPVITPHRFEMGEEWTENGHRIAGGVSRGRGGNREVIVVDWENDRALQRFYDKILRQVDDLKRRNKDLSGQDKGSVLEFVLWAVMQNVEPNLEKWQRYSAQRAGEDFSIGQVIQEGGVCRHMGILGAAVLERLIEEDVLQGQVFYIRGQGHGWAVYRTSHGEFFVFDAMQQRLRKQGRAQIYSLQDSYHAGHGQYRRYGDAQFFPESKIQTLPLKRAEYRTVLRNHVSEAPARPAGEARKGLRNEAVNQDQPPIRQEPNSGFGPGIHRLGQAEALAALDRYVARYGNNEVIVLSWVQQNVSDTTHWSRLSPQEVARRLRSGDVAAVQLKNGNIQFVRTPEAAMDREKIERRSAQQGGAVRGSSSDYSYIEPIEIDLAESSKILEIRSYKDIVGNNPRLAAQLNSEIGYFIVDPSNPDAYKGLRIGEEVIIGRAGSDRFQYPDSVSRKHARVKRVSENSFEIKDLGSSYGTSVKLTWRAWITTLEKEHRVQLVSDDSGFKLNERITMDQAREGFGRSTIVRAERGTTGRPRTDTVTTIGRQHGRPPAPPAPSQAMDLKDTIGGVGKAVIAAGLTGSLAAKAGAEVRVDPGVNPSIRPALEQAIPLITILLTWPIATRDPAIQRLSQIANRLLKDPNVEIIFSVEDLSRIQTGDPQQQELLSKGTARAMVEALGPDRFRVIFDYRTLRGGAAALITGLTHELIAHQAAREDAARARLSALEEERDTFAIEIKYLEALLSQPSLRAQFTGPAAVILRDVQQAVENEKVVLAWLESELQQVNDGISSLEYGVYGVLGTVGLGAVGTILFRRHRQWQRASGAVKDAFNKAREKGPGAFSRLNPTLQKQLIDKHWRGGSIPRSELEQAGLNRIQIREFRKHLRSSAPPNEPSDWDGGIQSGPIALGLIASGLASVFNMPLAGAVIVVMTLAVTAKMFWEKRHPSRPLAPRTVRGLALSLLIHALAAVAVIAPFSFATGARVDAPEARRSQIKDAVSMVYLPRQPVELPISPSSPIKRSPKPSVQKPEEPLNQDSASKGPIERLEGLADTAPPEAVQSSKGESELKASLQVHMTTTIEIADVLSLDEAIEAIREAYNPQSTADAIEIRADIDIKGETHRLHFYREKNTHLWIEKDSQSVPGWRVDIPDSGDAVSDFNRAAITLKTLLNKRTTLAATWLGSGLLFLLGLLPEAWARRLKSTPSGPGPKTQRSAPAGTVPNGTNGGGTGNVNRFTFPRTEQRSADLAPQEGATASIPPAPRGPGSAERAGGPGAKIKRNAPFTVPAVWTASPPAQDPDPAEAAADAWRDKPAAERPERRRPVPENLLRQDPAGQLKALKKLRRTDPPEFNRLLYQVTMEIPHVRDALAERRLKSNLSDADLAERARALVALKVAMLKAAQASPPSDWQATFDRNRNRPGKGTLASIALIAAAGGASLLLGLHPEGTRHAMDASGVQTAGGLMFLLGMLPDVLARFLKKMRGIPSTPREIDATNRAPAPPSAQKATEGEPPGGEEEPPGSPSGETVWEGRFLRVRLRGDAVRKVVKTFVGTHRVFEFSGEQRDRFARRLVKEHKDLREAGYPVPETWLEEGSLGVAGQRRARGRTLNELANRHGEDSEVVARARRSIGVLQQRAVRDFPDMNFDFSPNATFSETGDVLDWFDPTVPLDVLTFLRINYADGDSLLLLLRDLSIFLFNRMMLIGKRPGKRGAPINKDPQAPGRENPGDPQAPQSPEDILKNVQKADPDLDFTRARHLNGESAKGRVKQDSTFSEAYEVRRESANRTELLKIAGGAVFELSPEIATSNLAEEASWLGRFQDASFAPRLYYVYRGTERRDAGAAQAWDSIDALSREKIEGKLLHQALRKGLITPEEATRQFWGIFDSFERHQAQMLDFRIDAFVVTPRGELKLIDFGAIPPFADEPEQRRRLAREEWQRLLDSAPPGGMSGPIKNAVVALAIGASVLLGARPAPAQTRAVTPRVTRPPAAAVDNIVRPSSPVMLQAAQNLAQTDIRYSQAQQELRSQIKGYLSGYDTILRAYYTMTGHLNMYGDNPVMPETRMARIDEIVKRVWSTLPEDALPGYIRSLRVSEDDEVNLTLQQALFIFSTFDAGSYRFLQSNDIPIQLEDLGHAFAKTSGDRNAGLTGNPIMTLNSKFFFPLTGVSSLVGRPGYVTGFITHEGDHAKRFPPTLLRWAVGLLPDLYMDPIAIITYGLSPEEQPAFQAEKDLIKNAFDIELARGVFVSYSESVWVRFIFSVTLWASIGAFVWGIGKLLKAAVRKGPPSGGSRLRTAAGRVKAIVHDLMSYRARRARKIQEGIRYVGAVRAAGLAAPAGGYDGAKLAEAAPDPVQDFKKQADEARRDLLTPAQRAFGWAA